ncbi:MAG TPA: DUF4916 domain-containing protein [Jatrophihabitantaceae bacterium]|nr:DUF4916 domain-containing protein [Jatrophihabitantaceae bacterium]
MPHSQPGWIDDEQWVQLQRLVPITCVDLVPFRRRPDVVEFGLIERDSPFGQRWCQIGGRLRHGETLRSGLLRHLQHTLIGLDVELSADPQPEHVMQWFPRIPDDGVDHGFDPRQHAVALCFLAEAALDVVPSVVEGGEALRFGWFPVDEVGELGERAWPGTAAMIRAISRKLPPPASVRPAPNT